MLLPIPRPSLGLWLVFAVNGAVLASWAPRIPAVAGALRLTDGQLGAALFGVAAGSIPALLCTGRALRRVPASSVCTASGLAFAASLPLIALAGDFVQLTAALTVAGAASGALDVAMNTAAVQHEQRAGRRLLSRLHGGYSAGVLSGSAAGALAAAGSVPVPIHFVTAGLVLLAVLLFAARGVPRHPPAAPSPTSRDRVRVPALLLVVAIGALFLEGTVTDWSALLVTRDLGGGSAMGGFAVTAFTFAMAVSRTLGDRVVVVLGALPVAIGGGALAGTALAVGAVQPEPGVFLIAAALVGLGLGPLFPLLIRHAGTITGQIGSATATVSAVGYFAYLAGPPLVGTAAARWGLPPTLTLAALATGAVVVTAAMPALGARVPQRTGGTTCSTSDHP